MRDSQADPTLPARSRRVLAAAIAGLVSPLLWLGGVALEVRQGQLSHSLLSRPERLFGSSSAAARPVLMLLVAAALVAWLLLAGGLVTRIGRPRLAALASASLLAAATARVLVTGLAPGDQYLYQVSDGRGLAAVVLLICLPFGLILAGVAIGRRDLAMAWLSAVLGVVMAWVGVGATLASARVGALQPQLWAVEPVEGLAVAWSAVVGIWLLGPQWSLRSVVGWPPIPRPGRLASVALALVAVAGLVEISAPFVRDFGPTVASQLTGRTQVETIRVGEIDRTYRVYRPTQLAAKPGLVFVLHGVFGSGFLIQSSTGFDDQADRLGWVAAYPDGVLDGWDAFGSGPTWGQHPGADDVAFISAAIDRLEATDGIDPDRIYVTGLSRGAMMTYRLGCELSGRVAAIAPVSGNMATADGSADVPCNLAGPVSVLAIHGTADGMIPITGGKTDILFSPLTDVIGRWRVLDFCTGPQALTVDGASTTTSWACQGGSTVAMRVVDGGWHTWPVRSLSAAPSNPDDFDASRLIADFFVAHPLVAPGG